MSKRVYERIVLDMTRGMEVIEEVSFIYNGPFAMCDPENTDVLDAVKQEIKSNGENTKKSFDEIGKRFEEMKSDLNSVRELKDPILKEKIEKLTTSISTHQESIDTQNKAVEARMDAVEVAMQRTPKFIGGASEKQIEEAVQFTLGNASVNHKSIATLLDMHSDII